MTFFSLLGVGACIKYSQVTPAYKIQEQQYNISAVGTFTTSDQGSQEFKESMGGFKYSIEWETILKTDEVLKDDSFWMNLSIKSAKDQAITPGGEVLEFDGVQGKTLGLRIFPWGELLTLRYMDHLSGPSRYLDVFEPIIPSLFPYPPLLKRGENKERTNRWPIVEGDQSIGLSSQHALWERQDNEGGLWVYSYDGDWVSDIRGDLQQSSGTSKGTVWLDPESKWVVKHQWIWSRQLSSLSHPELIQHQNFEGTTWRVQ